jgi:hypothetical protein
VKILESYDDLDWSRNETKTPAQHTVTISYNGGPPFEVDVGDANKKEIDEQMAELRAAGREVSSSHAPSPQQKGVKSRAFFKALRDWVDTNDIRGVDGERLAYKTPSDAVYYPTWLVKRFKEATGMTLLERE